MSGTLHYAKTRLVSISDSHLRRALGANAGHLPEGSIAEDRIGR